MEPTSTVQPPSPPDPPPPPAPKKRAPLWPFLLGALVLGLLSSLRKRPELPQGAYEAGYLVGQTLGLALLGVFVWSLVARRWILAVAQVVGWGLTIGFALLTGGAPSGGSPGGSERREFVAGCVRTCAPKWQAAGRDPNSPFRGISDANVRDLCECYCEDMRSRITPAQWESMSDKQPGELRSNPELVREMQAMSVEAGQLCLPRFFPGWKPGE